MNITLLTGKKTIPKIPKSKDNFNKYLEAKITNDEFTHSIFKKLFQEKAPGD